VSCDVRTRENLGGKDSLYREGLVVLRRVIEGLTQVELRRNRRRRGGRIDRREGDLKFSRITPPSSYISPGKGVECL
jgi:hypothetical protein